MLYAQTRAGAPLAETVSRPLADWIFPILNTSQNLFAEMLLKQLGRRFGRAGSWEEGIAVERRFLIDSVRIDSTEFVSPGRLRALQRQPGRAPRLHPAAALHPCAPALCHLRRRACRSREASASLRTRFVGTPLEGRVRAKTGSIGGVNTLSGYIEQPGRQGAHLLGSGESPRAA